MAEYRSFNASNEPDTCLWCGRKLRHRQITKTMPAREAKAQGYKVTNAEMLKDGEWPVSAILGYEELGGDYVDGHFCGLRCGYQFGVAMADNGRRLQPPAEAEVYVIENDCDYTLPSIQ